MKNLLISIMIVLSATAHAEINCDINHIKTRIHNYNTSLDYNKATQESHNKKFKSFVAEHNRLKARLPEVNAMEPGLAQDKVMREMTIDNDRIRAEIYKLSEKQYGLTDAKFNTIAEGKALKSDMKWCGYDDDSDDD